MSHPILVTGAAGGQQGSTGRHIANLTRPPCAPPCKTLNAPFSRTPWPTVS
jgi:hypothetical protein